MSLARAFKYAGCRDVLMTLWPAHDRSTSKIMTSFFEQLPQNQPKAVALRQATLQYLQEEPNEALTHPYYWAGFSLIGSGKAIGNSGLHWKWFLLIPTGFLFLILFFRNRSLK